MGRGRAETFVLWPEHGVVREHLLALVNEPTPTCTLVRAITGGGKTALMNWLEAESGSALVVLGLRHGPDGLLMHLQEILEPEAVKKRLESLEPASPVDVLFPRVIELINARRYNLLLIDDADTLLNTSSSATQRAVVSMLGVLMQACGLHLVAFTQPSGTDLLQIAKWPKSSVLGLGPIGDSPALRAWLGGIEAKHGDHSYSGHLADDDVVVVLLEAYRGYIDFIQTAAIDAVMNHRHLGSYDITWDQLPDDLAARTRLLSKREDWADFIERVDAEWRRLT
jgi:hypothetical protein